MWSAGSHPKMNSSETKVSKTVKQQLEKPELDIEASNNPLSIGIPKQKGRRGEIRAKDKLLTLQNSGKIDHADNTERDPFSVDVSFTERILRETVSEDLMLKISQYLLVRRKQCFDAAVNKAVLRSAASSRQVAESKKGTTETAKSNESGVLALRSAEE